MLKQGVPMKMIKWLRSFLENRQARVKFNGAESKNRTMRQGLPQGSILSPVLFLFYINSLADSLPKKNLNALFADDVSILSTNSDKDTAARNVQDSVDHVVQWAKQWKLCLNAKKSESSFFSTSSQEANWKPHIVVDTKVIEFVSSPRFLGVLLDRSLQFGPHADYIISRIGDKQRIIAAVANTEWGWRKQFLVQLYSAFIHSTLAYA